MINLKKIYSGSNRVSKKIIYDGEGATKIIEVNVLGAQSYLDAKNVAYL